MGKKKSLSEVQRVQMVTLHGQNLSKRQIMSPQIGCSKTRVNQSIYKYQNEGSYTDRKKTGRPRTTAREENLTKRIVMRSATSLMKKIGAELLRKGRQVI